MFEEKYKVNIDKFMAAEHPMEELTDSTDSATENDEPEANASISKNEELILKHFNNLYPDNNLYIKGRSNPQKVYNKLQKGLDVFGNYTDEEEVLVYFDSSVFGGGGEGFILTHDTIFFKCGGEDEFYDYSVIEKVSSTFIGFKIDVGYEKASVSCVDTKVRDATIAAIRAMKEYLKS